MPAVDVVSEDVHDDRQADTFGVKAYVCDVANPDLVEEVASYSDISDAMRILAPTSNVARNTSAAMT